MPRKRKRKSEPTLEQPWFGSAVVGWLQSLDDDRRRVWLRRSGITAGLLVLGATITLGLGQVAAHVHAMPQYTAVLRLKLVNVPAWARTLRLPEHLRDILADFGHRTLLEPTLARDVAARLADSPWVESVIRVDKQFGGKLAIECAYRRPIAAVVVGANVAWIDARATCLPAPRNARLRLMTIEGIAAPIPGPGQPWDGYDIAAAVRLASLLVDEPYANEIVTLQFQNYGGRLDPRQEQIELRTGNGTRLIWGSAPGEEVEEPTAREKIEILRAMYRKYGQLDMDADWINLTRGTGTVGRGRARPAPGTRRRR